MVRESASSNGRPLVYEPATPSKTDSKFSSHQKHRKGGKYGKKKRIEINNQQDEQKDRNSYRSCNELLSDFQGVSSHFYL